MELDGIGLISIYVINLEKDIERKRHMETLLDKFAINPTFINGVYGKALTEKEKYRECTQFCAKFCTDSAIGCALSHKKAWKRMIKNNDSVAIIMEDDIILNPNYRSILTQVWNDLPKDWDFVYLGCAGACDIDQKYDLYAKLIGLFGIGHYQKISNNLFVPQVPLAFHCYMLSNKGARKLLNLIPQVWQNIDASILPFMDKLNIYAVNPQIAMQKDTASNTSNNISQRYPVYINNYLDKFKDKVNITHGYKMSFPFYRIYGYDINVYTFVFLVLGIITGTVLKSMQITKKRKYLIIVGILVAINLPECRHMSSNNVTNVIGNGLLFTIAALFFEN